MGHLKLFNIQELIKTYELENFVETGTLFGETIDFILPFSFKTIFSMEIVPDLVVKCRDKYKGQDRVVIYEGDTSTDFSMLLSNIPPRSNTLFWLDAHFPGSEGCNLPYDSEKEETKRIPLEKELQQIREFRDYSKDVFIIDDLRVYEDANFEDGSWSDRKTLGGEGIKFIEDFLLDSHTLHKLYNHQGYIVGLPK